MHMNLFQISCLFFLLPGVEGVGGWMPEPRCTIQGKLWLCFSDSLVWCCVQTMFAFSHHCSAWWSRPISLLFFPLKGSSRGDGVGEWGSWSTGFSETKKKKKPVAKGWNWCDGKLTANRFRVTKCQAAFSSQIFPRWLLAKTVKDAAGVISMKRSPPGIRSRRLSERFWSPNWSVRALRWLNVVAK